MTTLRRIHLFLTIVILSTICSKSRCEDKPAIHEIECQGSVMWLHCVNRSFAITITSAIYGRDLPGYILCLNNNSTGLSDEVNCDGDVFDLVKEKCDGKMNCSIPVNKQTLQEPCEHVYKYLDVAYKCEDVLTRSFRDLSVSNKNKTQPTKPQSPTSIVTTTSSSSPPTLVASEEKLSTVKTSQKSSILSTSRPRSSARSSHSSTSHHSVSVTQVTQYTTTTTSTNLHSTTAPSENRKTKGNLRTIKLFHFILSFHIVREEYLQKHPANSFVWFLCGLLSGLHVMIVVFYCLHRRRTRRGKPDGKRDNISYLKQKFLLQKPHDEKIKLRSKEDEAMEMSSQFGETA